MALKISGTRVVSYGGGGIVTNIAVGNTALNINSTGARNAALGNEALRVNSTGSDNVALGNNTLYSNTTGLENIAVGSQALFSNTTGIENTAVGHTALYSNTIGIRNTAVGSDALFGVISGSNNLGLGKDAGRNIQHGSGNIVLGAYSGTASPISTNGNNWIVLSTSNGTIRQVISPTGNVGFGTTNPAQQLDVSGSVNAVSYLVGSYDVSARSRESQIEVVIDGGGAAVTTGIKGDLRVPFDCTIIDWSVVANTTGNVVVDIWRTTYANYPPVSANTITGTAKPTLSSNNKAINTTLTGWGNTSLLKDDYLRFNVDSANTVGRVTLSLKVNKV